MAVTINFYDKFIEYVGDGGIDLDSDTFTIILMDSSHAYTSTDTSLASLGGKPPTNELATGNGYTQDAETLGSVTWTESGGTLTFDAADASWTASGGSIGPADDGVIYDESATTPAADLLMCSIDFDGSQTAGDGTDFIVSFNASGIFTIS